MKKILFFLLLPLLAISQTQTFSVPPIIKGVQKLNSNEKILTINPTTNKVEYIEKNSISDTTSIHKTGNETKTGVLNIQNPSLDDANIVTTVKNQAGTTVASVDGEGDIIANGSVAIKGVQLNTSVAVADLGTAGEQGYTYDGTNHYIFGTNVITKLNSSFATTVSNTNALSGISGVDHLGDGVYLGGYLYAPVETYPAVTGMKIAKYNATTLALDTTYDISAQGHECSSITTDGTTLYISSYLDGTKIWKYSLTGTYLGFITVSTPFTNNIQGISFYNNSFTVVEQTKISRMTLDGGSTTYLMPVPGNIANTHRGEGLQVVDGQIRLVVLDVVPSLQYIDTVPTSTDVIKGDNTGLFTAKYARINSSGNINDFPLQNTGGAVFSNISTTTDYARVPLYSHVLGNRGSGNVPMFATKTDKTTSTGMFFMALQNADAVRTAEADVIFRTANSVGSALTTSGRAFDFNNGTNALLGIDRDGTTTISNVSGQATLYLRGGSNFYQIFGKSSSNEMGLFDFTNGVTFFRYTGAPTVASPKVSFLEAGAGNLLVGSSTVVGSARLQVTGTQSITGQFSSTLATGTSPFSVVSTTVNTNLNADLLDGQHGAYYAPIASPTFTGTPLAPTAMTGTNTTQIATTAFVTDAVSTAAKWTTSGSDIYNSNSGNVGVGVTPTAKLSVKSTDAISFPNILDLKNTAGTNRFSVSDVGQVSVPVLLRAESINGISGGGYMSFGNGGVFFAPESTSSGSQNVISQQYSFVPTSGSGALNMINLAPTINQTGSSTSITRGLYVNPTLTSAVDFRALEITSGKVIIPDATASNEAVTKGQLDTAIAGVGSVNTAFATETYASTISRAYDSDNPNSIIALTGDLDYTLTGTSNGNSGMLTLTGCVGREIILNGTSAINVTGGVDKMYFYFINDGTGLEWFRSYKEVTSSSTDISGKADIQGTTLYHSLAWTTDGSLSISGTTVTGTGTSFDSQMVGARLTADGVSYIIDGYTSSTVLSISTSVTGTLSIANGDWGIYNSLLEQDLSIPGRYYIRAPYNRNNKTFFNNDGSVFFNENGFGSNGDVYFYGNLNSPNNIEITNITSGLILKSPDGTRWKSSISNAGVVTWTAL